MGKFKDEHGKSRIGLFLKNRGKDIVNAALDVFPIPNIFKLIPDRNQDGKINFKDVKWFEAAAGIAILLGLVKIGVIDFNQLLEFVKVFTQ